MVIPDEWDLKKNKNNFLINNFTWLNIFWVELFDIFQHCYEI